MVETRPVRPPQREDRLCRVTSAARGTSTKPGSCLGRRRIITRSWCSWCAHDPLLPSDETLEVVGAELLGAFFLVAVIAGVLTFALLRAAAKKADAMIVVSVSLLTLVAIVGFIATQSEALITLAGTGVGALAGAITNLFGGTPDDHAD